MSKKLAFPVFCKDYHGFVVPFVVILNDQSESKKLIELLDKLKKLTVDTRKELKRHGYSVLNTTSDNWEIARQAFHF